MKDALAIHRWLLSHQVHHEIVRLPRVLTCSDDLPELLGMPADHCVAVTLFEVTPRSLKDRAEPVAVIASVAAPPTPGTVASVLRARSVKLATTYAVNSVTDYAAGLVCPLLLPETLTTLVDQRLIDHLDPDELVVTATGERRTALRLRAIHLFALASGKPVELAGHGLVS